MWHAKRNNATDRCAVYRSSSKWKNGNFSVFVRKEMAYIKINSNYDKNRLWIYIGRKCLANDVPHKFFVVNGLFEAQNNTKRKRK